MLIVFVSLIKFIAYINISSSKMLSFDYTCIYQFLENYISQYIEID